MSTLTRDRRTIVGISCVWVAQNVCYGFRNDLAKILPRLCPSLAMEFDDGKASKSPPEGQNGASEGQKSSSDRPWDAQEQPKSPQDNKFRVFVDIIDKFLKVVPIFE